MRNPNNRPLRREYPRESNPQENILSIFHVSDQGFNDVSVILHVLRPPFWGSAFCRVWFAYGHFSLYTSVGGARIHLSHECSFNRNPLGNVIQYSSGLPCSGSQQTLADRLRSR